MFDVFVFGDVIFLFCDFIYDGCVCRVCGVSVAWQHDSNVVLSSDVCMLVDSIVVVLCVE